MLQSLYYEIQKYNKTYDALVIKSKLFDLIQYIFNRKWPKTIRGGP